MFSLGRKIRLSLARLGLTPFPAGLHHHPTADSVKGVGHQPCHCRHGLGNHPAHNNVHILGVRQHPCEQSQEAKWPWNDSSQQLGKKQGGISRRRATGPPTSCPPFRKNPPLARCLANNQAVNRSCWLPSLDPGKPESCPGYRACWSASKLNSVTDRAVARGSEAPPSSSLNNSRPEFISVEDKENPLAVYPYHATSSFSSLSLAQGLE